MVARARDVDRQRGESVENDLVVAAQRVHLVARPQAEDRGADHFDRQALHLVQPADLAGGGPLLERGLDGRLHLREVVGHRGAREGLVDGALAGAVRRAVEQRQAAPGEELLHVRRHRVVALDFGVVDELPRRVGAGDDHRIPAQETGAEDAAVAGQTLVDEAERIPGEGKRLADQR